MANRNPMLQVRSKKALEYTNNIQFRQKHTLEYKVLPILLIMYKR